MLDFGCGVGRHVIAWAGMAQRVTAVDVSPSMLEETQRNCEIRGIENVDLVRSDDSLSRVQGTFDLVHSYIVLQHIPRQRGMRLIECLVDRLEPGGVGALHMLHGGRAGRAWLRHAAAQLAGRIPGVRHVISAVMPHRRVGDPPMQMNAYDLDAVIGLLRTMGIHRLEVTLTEHGNDRGMMLFLVRDRSFPSSPCASLGRP